MSGWGRYRKKPVVIEAMQLVGTTAEFHAIYQWIEANTLGSFEPMAVIEGREPYPASASTHATAVSSSPRWRACTGPTPATGLFAA